MYHDVVRLAEITKLADCRGVQVIQLAVPVNFEFGDMRPSWCRWIRRAGQPLSGVRRLQPSACELRAAEAILPCRLFTLLSESSVELGWICNCSVNRRSA